MLPSIDHAGTGATGLGPGILHCQHTWLHLRDDFTSDSRPFGQEAEPFHSYTATPPRYMDVSCLKYLPKTDGDETGLFLKDEYTAFDETCVQSCRCPEYHQVFLRTSNRPPPTIQVPVLINRSRLIGQLLSAKDEACTAGFDAGEGTRKEVMEGIMLEDGRCCQMPGSRRRSRDSRCACNSICQEILETPGYSI